MTPERLRLLIVEDEEAHIEAIRRAFDAAGGKVDIRTAGTLREYLELVSENPIDIALIDLNLPDGRAVEVLTHPPEDGPFPIIVMTAFGNQQVVVEVMKAGALDYMVKSPEAFAMLPRTVEVALREWKLLQKHKDVQQRLRMTQRCVDHASDPIFWVSSHGRILYANEAACSKLGYTPDEFLAMSVADLDPNLPADVWPDHWAELKRRGSVVLESQHRTKDGRAFPVEVSANFLDFSGTEIGFAFTRDITERKQAEAVTHEMEGLLNTVGRIAKIGGWKMDLIARKATWTQGTHDIVEIAPGQPIPGPDEHVNYYLPEYRPLVTEAMRALIEDDKPLDFEAQLRTAKGNVKWCRAVGRAVRKGGRTVEIYGTFQDITERKRAEDSVRQAEERYRSIFENAIEGIYQSSPDGRVLNANPAMAAIHGYASPEEFIADIHDAGQQLYVDSSRRAEFKRLMEDRGKVVGFETCVRRKDGRLIWISANARAVRGADGRILCYEGTVQDITERKRAEEAIQKLNNELEQRVRNRTAQLEAANKELEAFSYSVSHDLRAPLRGINGFANILTEDYAPRLDDEGRRVLKTISDEAVRMGQLIDELLAFSRIGRQAMQSAEVDMTAMARHEFDKCAKQAPGRDIRLQLHPLPPAQCDPHLLPHVWTNLISNAVKYTRGKPVAEIEITGRVDGGELVYCVKDNGAGFDMRYVDRLFGVFQRLHANTEFEGTGVGLALVKRVIERHGGRVWAEGKIGEGAAFYFKLPAGGSQ
jgi:PAS domain S-box-containing protein